jgi:hypothetical protein
VHNIRRRERKPQRKKRERERKLQWRLIGCWVRLNVGGSISLSLSFTTWGQKSLLCIFFISFYPANFALLPCTAPTVKSADVFQKWSAEIKEIFWNILE